MKNKREKKKSASLSAVRRVLKFIGKYKLSLVFSVVLAAASVALTLWLPIIFGNAIDCITGKNSVDIPGVVRNLVFAGAVIAVTAALSWLMNVQNNRITYGVARDIRALAIRKIQTLPFSYLDSHPDGDTVSRVIADVDQFTDGLLMGFTQLFTGVVTVLGTVGFMLSINWKIALAVIVLTPLSLVLSKFIASRTYSMFLLQSKLRGEQTGFIDEMITSQKTVQAFGREKANTEKFDEINVRLEKASLRATFFSSLVNPTTRLINNIVYALVAFTGAVVAIGGGLTVGGLSCLLAYATQYAKPFNEISGVVTELQNAVACAGRVFELLDEADEAPDGEGGLDNCQGSVEMRHVDFTYVPGRKLIENLSLHARPGMRVAIVGPTGCGKTTLINLLMRFYDPVNGEVCIDGRDIRTLKRHSFRANYGMVLQDTWLETGTVRDNIAMGRPDATDSEIVEAAKRSHAHSFIKRLPKGYDTVISSSGGLSQGQRQLLCIARIMLCLPPMLILDEATSSIDTRTEMKIQDAFAVMMKGRTSFIVAHRLSTVRNADLILVMNGGTIIEQGTHRELLDKKGFYYKLYNSQFAN